VNLHTFTLILDGPLAITPGLEDAVYEAGCGDAALGHRGQVVYLEFDRKAPTFKDAVLSGIRDVQRIPDVRAARVEPDEFVSASDVARRTGRSREGIRLLAEGSRGPGGFPAPVVGSGSGSRRLWRWSEVAAWMSQQGLEPGGPEEKARFIGAVNGALDLARNADEDTRSEILEALGVGGPPAGLAPRG
jgi:hypothetical protein